MNWTGKRVLVTGAGGFIGSHLCEQLLERGANVTALIRYTSRASWGNLEFLHGDLRERLAVTAGSVEDTEFVHTAVGGQDVVFHLAALIGIPYSYVAPRSYVDVNIGGTLNVLEACRASGVERLVHTSTSEAYGTARFTPINEDHPLQGQSPYSASKIAADKMAESYHLAFELPVTTVRPFNCYGPRQSARAIIPTVISQALSQPQIRLGALSPTRDLTFVKDTAAGFIRAAEAPEAVGETVNLGTGKSISMGDLTNLILQLMECEKPVECDEQRIRPGNSEVMALVCDPQKTSNLLGWAPELTLKQGLLETIKFVRANPDFYRADEYSR